MCPRTGVHNPQGAMGKVVPSKKVRIVDTESLEDVEAGSPGELLVSSESMVKERIWNKPEETASSFVRIGDLTWYRTGDVVRLDEDGYLVFVDRTVDTIKHKGYRVSASEIEAILQEHPAVISSCVVGLPDEKVGERIKAFVVLKKDVKGITGYDLIKWSRQRLPSYKIPNTSSSGTCCPSPRWENCCGGKFVERKRRADRCRSMEVRANPLFSNHDRRFGPAEPPVMSFRAIARNLVRRMTGSWRFLSSLRSIRNDKRPPFVR